MIREEILKGKNGRTVRIICKNTPWREYIDEFIRQDLDYMIIHILPGLYKSTYSAKSGLDAAIRTSKMKGISSGIINGNLCLIRNINYA